MLLSPQVAFRCTAVVQHLDPARIAAAATAAYLDIPDDLRPACSPQFLIAHEEARQIYMARSPAPDAARLREERVALHELVKELFKAARSGYAQKYGFIPSDPRPDKLLNSLFL